jgi:hypothetical protein
LQNAVVGLPLSAEKVKQAFASQEKAAGPFTEKFLVKVPAASSVLFSPLSLFQIEVFSPQRRESVGIRGRHTLGPSAIVPPAALFPCLRGGLQCHSRT